MITTMQRDIALGQAINLVHAEWMRQGLKVIDTNRDDFISRVEEMHQIILTLKERSMEVKE